MTSILKIATRIGLPLASIAILILVGTTYILPTEQPKATISGPTNAQVGELVRLEVNVSADDFQWVVIPESTDFEITANKAVFSARREGVYLFIAAYCYRDKVYLLRHEITIGNPPPGPEPGPGPGPPTPPPGPEADIQELIPYWCKTLNIPAETRVKLASNFSTTAAAASTGQYTNVQDLVAATASLNKPLGADELLDNITKYIVAKAQAGELETMNQHVILWNQISSALRPTMKK